MFLGVDGGGTKTAFLILSPEGAALARYEGGSSYHPEVGIDGVRAVLKEGVREVLAEEREAAGRFFDTVLRPSDHALLLGFSSTLVLWQDFTSSSERLKKALADLHAVPFRGLPAIGQSMPGTLLYDAAYQTAKGKLGRVPGRKAMLIVSDGLDNGSQEHLEDAIEAVQATNTIVYGVCYDQKFSGCSFLKGLAEPTGGRMFEAGKKRTIEEIFQIIEHELRSQYSIGFAPINGAHDGKFRKLQVKALKPGLRVSVRRGYYAPDRLAQN